MIENIAPHTSGSSFETQSKTTTQFPPLVRPSARDFSARPTSRSKLSPGRLPAPPKLHVTENASPHHSISESATILRTRSPTRTISDSLHSINTARNLFSDQQPKRSVGRKQFSTVGAT